MPQSMLELKVSLAQLTVSELKKVLSDRRIAATGARRKEDLLLKVIENTDALDLAKKRLVEKLATSAVTVPADLGRRSAINPYDDMAKSLKPEASSSELDQLVLVLKAIYKLGYTLDDYKNPPDELRFASKEGWKHALKQYRQAKEVVTSLENSLGTLEEMEGSVFRYPLGGPIQDTATLLATVRDIRDRAAGDVAEHELLYRHICIRPGSPGYEDGDSQEGI